PLDTASTVYPSSRSTALSDDRTPGSSSTMRMVGFIWTASARQLDCKTSTARRVVPHVDAAAVLGDDAANDRQAEAAAAALGRVVRQEQLLALRGRNTGSVVRDDHAYHAVGPVDLRLDEDLAAPLHRF